MRTFNIDFFGKRKLFLIISLAIIVVGLIFNVIFGTKLDVQFAGGAVIKYSVDGEVDQNDMQALIKKTTGRDCSVATNQLIATGENQITVTFAGNKALTLEEQTAIADTLTVEVPERTFEVVESSSVDPAMGSKFFAKCLVCFAITVVFLMVYIAFRFKKIGGLAAGATAIAALVHDVLMVYFAFVIFGMNINDIFIAVILTIVGYSLNDTIVIYDRIRENERLMPKAEISEIINKSLNQTFGRSVWTSVTTFLALLVVFVVATIYGLTTVQTFALPMMFGVISGCYSSLCIAAPLYGMWQVKKAKKA